MIYILTFFIFVLAFVIILLYLKNTKLLKILRILSEKNKQISFGIWKSDKLFYYTPTFEESAKKLNINFNEFKKVSKNKLKSLLEKYPTLQEILETIILNYHDENISFDIELPIGNEFFFVKFFRTKINNIKYSFVYVINLSTNIKNFAEDLLKPLLNTPSEVFQCVLDGKSTHILGEKIFQYLNKINMVDSFVLGVKQNDGSVKIHYANVDGEELIDFIIPPEQKSITSYIIDFKVKQYFKNSFDIKLPPGYKKIHVGENIPNSIYGVPLSFDNQTFGAVLFEKRGIDQFTFKDFYLFDLFAYIISINYKLKNTIRELRIEKEKNYLNSIVDPLTKAFNRTFLNHFLEKTIAYSKRNKQENTLVFIDLDNFKHINDQHGHFYGDEILKNFVSVAKKTLRKMDVIARYGGDEFIIVLPNTNIKTSKKVINRLQKEASKLQTPIRFSYGLINIDPEKDLEETLRTVDEKMYEMKKMQKDS
ncbi:sensor domain-containing diguanylate cyclase [Thermosipho atlanticus]|uniref:Diguanylate cyclase (GGDEF) domain-containing protein n=1 Tax=Thermosipho atlanticus DSM 15807 TaxID=1123380 RepID=A0A1M5TU43_9BACT|nr:sensor domain-containing diguanylate cyclase [Thermosipho atlanticus]SHH54307.1 diguanylate cyclase (GGDEF) domain-containing protein [Thermosipho atlanticus DSM 15807]